MTQSRLIKKATKRKANIIAMKDAGATWEEIAEVVGLDWKDVIHIYHERPLEKKEETKCTL